MSKEVIQKIDAPGSESKEIIQSKAFMNGGSQAVRIPAKWRFDSDELEIEYDEASKTVMIRASTKAQKKAEFIALVRSLTEAEREEVEAGLSAFQRDSAPWKPSEEMEKFMEETK